METTTSLTLQLKLKLFNFFAFLLFGGLFALFLYYKTFGGIGFKIAKGYFELTSGVISIVLIALAFAMAKLVTPKRLSTHRIPIIIISILLLLYTLTTINTWITNNTNGLFLGGDALNNLGIDDTLYFTIYYFISTFVCIYALTLSITYGLMAIKGECENTILSNRYLTKLFNALAFAALGVFLFFHWWN